jgi:ABC-type transport system involved in multi-copper enzyme maturation permease subunit
MKWAAWRQSRLEFIIGLVFLAGMAALLVPMGLHQLSLFKNLGLANMSPSNPAYASLSEQFLDSYPQWLNQMVTLTGVILYIFGALLAIPIILEFEQRTYRLAWTQSITRKRWLLTKLGFALITALVISGLYTILVTWFLGPQNLITGSFVNFTQQDIVPVSFAVFGFAAALAAGVLGRRSSIGVIVAVVACLVATTIALPVLGRGLPFNYLKPLEEVSVFTVPASSSGQDIVVRIGGDLPVGSKVVSHYFIDASGNHVPVMQVINSSPGSIRQVTEYQPPGRYWIFQGIEAFIFFGASIALLCGSFWVIVHQLR